MTCQDGFSINIFMNVFIFISGRYAFLRLEINSGRFCTAPPRSVSHLDSGLDLDLPYDPKGVSTKYFTSLFPSFYVAYVRFILYDWLLTAIHKTCSICYPNSFQPLTLYPLAYLLTFCCCPTSRYHSSFSAQSH